MNQKGQIHLAGILLILIFLIEIHSMLPLVRDYAIPLLTVVDDTVTSGVESVARSGMRATQVADAYRQRALERRRLAEEREMAAAERDKGIGQLQQSVGDLRSKSFQRDILIQKIVMLERRLYELESRCPAMADAVDTRPQGDF